MPEEEKPIKKEIPESVPKKDPEGPFDFEASPEQKKWDDVTNEVEHIVDALGHPIDKEIKKTIVALNVLGISTDGSCEGHAWENGAGAPWVQIGAVNEPEEIYNGQKEIFARLAQENKISVEELEKISKEEYWGIYAKAMEECSKNGETKEIIAWQRENEILRMVTERLVTDFYKNRDVSEDIKIKFEDIGGWGSFRIFSGSEEDYSKGERNPDDLTEKEKEELEKRIIGYRKELEAFAEFLRGNFFAEGESYINRIRKEMQEKIDMEKITELRGKNGPHFDWKEFWKTQQRNSPTRKEVFPNGEDADLSEGDVVKALNKFFADHESDLWHMSGIDAEEFPEVIDSDIRDICLKLNELPYLKTREGCGGHELDRLGDISDIGYSEPYLTFYAEQKNPNFQIFLKKLNAKIDQFKKSNLPGMENVVLDIAADKECDVEVENVKMYTYDISIIPTKEWCQRNNKKYIERPKSPGPYYKWCDERGYERSEDEESEPYKLWYAEKEKYWKELERYGQEYGEYFRSDEVRKLRDAFFKAFEVEI